MGMVVTIRFANYFHFSLFSPVHDHIHHFLSNGVEPPGVVVSGVLLASDHLLRVEELPVDSSTDLRKG